MARPQRDRHGLDADALGTRMHFFALVLRGPVAGLDEPRFVREMAKAIGMTAAYRAKLWRYPVNGAGGNGVTVVQPITESFIALDAWPDHGAAYLVICSCRPFVASPVYVVARRHGLEPGQETSASLGLPHG